MCGCVLRGGAAVGQQHEVGKRPNYGPYTSTVWHKTTLMSQGLTGFMGRGGRPLIQVCDSLACHHCWNLAPLRAFQGLAAELHREPG